MPTARDTDWAQIAGLYRELSRHQPSPVIVVALVIAEDMADGPERGLARLAELEAPGALAGSYRVVAARADLLRRAGRFAEAAGAYDVAATMAPTGRERRFFTDRALRCRQDSTVSTSWPPACVAPPSLVEQIASPTFRSRFEI